MLTNSGKLQGTMCMFLTAYEDLKITLQDPNLRRCLSDAGYGFEEQAHPFILIVVCKAHELFSDT